MASYSTTSSPLPWLEPYLTDLASRGQEVANQGYTQSPGTYTEANPYLTAGWEATANRAMQGSPLMSTANSQLQNIMSGGMMNANPYLDQQIQQAQGDLASSFNQVNVPAWAKAMQSSGSFGNTGVQEAAGYDYGNLANAMGRISTDMRGNAYNTERGYMQQAIGMAPSFANQDYVDSQQLLNVGAQVQNQNQAAQNQNQAWFTEAQNFPMQQLQNYGSILGMAGGGGGVQTQTQPDPSTASQVIGGALTGSQLLELLFGGK